MKNQTFTLIFIITVLWMVGSWGFKCAMDKKGAKEVEKVQDSMPEPSASSPSNDAPLSPQDQETDAPEYSGTPEKKKSNTAHLDLSINGIGSSISRTSVLTQKTAVTPLSTIPEDGPVMVWQKKPTLMSIKKIVVRPAILQL